jgi:carbamoyl-phosphate synthase small subunit
MTSSLSAPLPAALAPALPAVLVLADGSQFVARSVGFAGESAGEVVFNTALTGYQEILTDPSYCKQIVTLTYPHIGNVGVNNNDAEADQVYATGLVIRDLPRLASNWRSQESLDAYLQRHKVVAIADLDTRALTATLRRTGAQNGAIVTGEVGADVAALAARGLELAQGFAGINGLDLAKVVSTRTPYIYRDGSIDVLSGTARTLERRFKVVAYDFGAKRNILRMLVDVGCEVHVVPAQTSARDVFAMQPDGVFLSNGPGDPAPCDYAISAIREFIAAKVPTFGICLGHQLLALAAGARTLKMKFGHHGANHPVQDLRTGKVMISSQNHGFAVDEQTLPGNVLATHRSLFDGSNQGIRLTDAPAFSFQGHPEASPGPRDVAPLFDEFAAMMHAALKRAA